MDLWVTLYAHNLMFDLSEWLNEVDVVTYWTWKAEGLANLEAGFAAAEASTPHARQVLGCYMYDYGIQNLMPLDLMQ